MAFIELDGLTRNFDGNVTALDGVSLSIEKGEWLAVMGPPAAVPCGFSTTSKRQRTGLACEFLQWAEAERVAFVR